MRFLLSPLLSFHWMVVFALLAIIASSGPHGFDRIVAILGGLPTGATPFFDSAVSGVFALIFAFVAVLFLWSLLTGGQVDGFPRPVDDVAMLAFGAAVAATTAFLLVVALLPESGLFATVALQTGALGASYAAIHAERRSEMLVADDTGDQPSRARLMAVGAAQVSMLARFSDRQTGAQT